MLDGQDLIHLGAIQAAEAIQAGKITSEELVQACIDRIEEVDGTVQAWAYFNPESALEQARKCHRAHQEGRSLGPLHGVPVGIKDIFDTDDMPTEDGTILHIGRRPLTDASVVSQLRSVGAIIVGKTVTTELAVYAPGKTTNPHDPTRTPGGSSSGSAAAVASLMIPVAVGTQTNGSIIRPASFCGVVGFKPTYGLISRHGVLRLSRPLDQVGVFARSVEDAAFFAEQITVFDDRDPDMRPKGRPSLLATALDEPPLTPRFAFVKSPVWDNAEDDMKQAFDELVDELGKNVEEVSLPKPFDDAVAMHQTLMYADLAKSFSREYEQGADRLSTSLKAMIEEGQTYLAVDYNRAMEHREGFNELLNGMFEDFDAILTPASNGGAPVGLDSTGDPVFSTIWTLCGTPAISLPMLQGESGMPMGVQLIGPRGDDARLLRTARWLMNQIQ
ncbi:MAG: amidase [Arenicellales bacterium]|nr:amidase [Arenicellales bacterium]